MSEKILRWLFNIAGIIGLYGFLAVRIQPLFNAVLIEKYIPEYWENTKWGELYYFNFIKNFQENELPEYSIKYRFSNRHPKLKEADLLIFGDSFFDFSRMTTFPEQLGDSLNKKVFYARFDRPMEYLDENKYVNSTKKYIIFETAERFLLDRFTSPQNEFAMKDERSMPRRWVSYIRDFIFIDESELVFNQLLYRSYLTSDIHSTINTFKFNTLGYISTQTPKYNLDSNIPWLFGASEVGITERGYYYQHSQSEIENYCSNIEILRDNLREKYNLELIFMIIPSKYTIYHTLLNNDTYNNFIPRMYDELDNRSIPTIKFYKEFVDRHNDELLYYGTDTHWTEKGLLIALNKTLKLYDSLQVVATNNIQSIGVNSQNNN